MTAPRILHLTDLHLYASERGVLRGVVTQRSLDRVLERAQRHGWPPDCILLTGDLVHDCSRTGYARLRERFSAFKVPVYCIAGNHDDPELMRTMLDVEPLHYAGSASLGSWCIVLLDTHVPGEDGGAVAPETLDRLDATLNEAAAQHALLCLHHQPVAVGSAWLDALGVANRDALFAVINRHANVRALLWGHVHQAFDEQSGDLRLLATPSTCVQFKPHCTRFRYDSLPPACRWLTLHDDGRIGTELLWADA
jgi:3',5'-cyclic-AMP phosphodiesterase